MFSRSELGGGVRLVRTEVFAGLVTALALIPETISFSIVAGVGPEIGLFTSVIFVLTISIVGGRPAMVSAAAGSVAVVLAPLVASHGVQYLMAAVILGGVLQLLLAWAQVTKLMKFVPNSVLTGFVNSLAILIFSAQIPHVIGVPWLVYPMVVGGLLLMVVLPKVTTVIPAPLIVTVFLTVAAVAFAIGVPRVGDEGELTGNLPALALPDVPFTWATLGIIAPYAVAMALIGLLETLITQRIVDGLTHKHTSPVHEAQGQGVANVVTGFFGGMGGCAMIGQTMMNVKSCGGRTRLSTITAGLALLVMLVVFTPALAAIPMAALVAVMIVVSYTTMDWKSIAPKTLRSVSRADSVAMVVTMAVTLPTHNLAYGVIAGVAVSMVLRKVARTRDELVDLAKS